MPPPPQLPPPAGSSSSVPHLPPTAIDATTQAGPRYNHGEPADTPRAAAVRARRPLSPARGQEPTALSPAPALTARAAGRTRSATFCVTPTTGRAVSGNCRGEPRTGGNGRSRPTAHGEWRKVPSAAGWWRSRASRRVLAAALSQGCTGSQNRLQDLVA